jgi:predicted unusual protein kinase regulating ubiquinone biosynthesis (AarF/ABC1/UbiB family)
VASTQTKVAHGPHGEPDPAQTTLELDDDDRPRHVYPPLGALRVFIAYYTTFRVVLSYVAMRWRTRYRSAATSEVMWQRAHLDNARRIERAISRLQGLFLKVGQLISIMTNFLPDEFRRQLEGLQDQVPPRPYADVDKRIREELGRAPQEIFAEFQERPVASASIGQVHRARLRTGEEVAVKIQYPDVEDLVASDLKVVRFIFRVLNYFAPYHGFDGVYREIRQMVLAELDFRGEADNMERIAGAFAGRTDVAFPSVVRELSTSRVLTTSWVEGVKVSDRQRLAQLGVDRTELARAVVAAYCKQIFTDGVYHADPHPGNLLIRKQALGEVTIVFIDFGAVAEVSPKMRRGIGDLIQGAITRDTPRVVTAMKSMGFISRNADTAVFDKVVDFFHERLHEEVKFDSFSLKDVKFDPQKSLQNLADLRRMDVSFRDLMEHFHVPKEWIMLERTVLLLLGLCTELDPTLNPMSVIRPYLEEFVLGKEKDWQSFALDSTKDVAATVFGLPSELKRFLLRAQRGELEVKVRAIDEHARMLYALGHQVIFTALTITAATFGMIFDGRGRAYEAKLAFGFAGFLGLFLMGSLVLGRGRFKRRR